tara:strand:- start:495 stop:1076 length:582 start_codon:yes stop_codon:yes gene_type:complete
MIKVFSLIKVFLFSCLITNVANAQTSTINKNEYENIVNFIKAQDIKCDWEWVGNEAYSASNNIYNLSENLSLIGMLCTQGSPNSTQVWLFKDVTSTEKYELITFAYPIIDTLNNHRILGISSRNRVYGSFFKQADGIIYSSLFHSAGDYSEDAEYELDYRPEFSIRRFLLTSFTADTNKDGIKKNNIFLEFEE